MPAGTATYLHSYWLFGFTPDVLYERLPTHLCYHATGRPTCYFTVICAFYSHGDPFDVLRFTLAPFAPRLQTLTPFACCRCATRFLTYYARATCLSSGIPCCDCTRYVDLPLEPRYAYLPLWFFHQIPPSTGSGYGVSDVLYYIGRFINTVRLRAMEQRRFWLLVLPTHTPHCGCASIPLVRLTTGTYHTLTKAYPRYTTAGIARTVLTLCAFLRQTRTAGV